MSWSTANKIKAVILDIDGVMTNGLVAYGPEDNFKFFNIKDGHAIKMALRDDIKVGIISGRADAANKRRAEELSMSFYYFGEKNKKSAWERMLIEQNLSSDECIYVGDDLVDIPLIRSAAIGIAVADAVEEVKDYADYVTNAEGGQGAVREVIVKLMKEKGLWGNAIQQYLE
jgi:3-deoxy-D-manno-octulosonate 8-phosphate phosphatase (KDO 8-P phosphatase)